MFRFRKITGEDFPQMLEWLSKEHIKQWWDDGDDTLEKVALHYGKNRIMLRDSFWRKSKEKSENQSVIFNTTWQQTI